MCRIILNIKMVSSCCWFWEVQWETRVRFPTPLLWCRLWLLPLRTLCLSKEQFGTWSPSRCWTIECLIVARTAEPTCNNQVQPVTANCRTSVIDGAVQSAITTRIACQISPDIAVIFVSWSVLNVCSLPISVHVACSVSNLQSSHASFDLGYVFS